MSCRSDCGGRSNVDQTIRTGIKLGQSTSPRTRDDPVGQSTHGSHDNHPAESEDNRYDKHADGVEFGRIVEICQNTPTQSTERTHNPQKFVIGRICIFDVDSSGGLALVSQRQYRRIEECTYNRISIAPTGLSDGDFELNRAGLTACEFARDPQSASLVSQQNSPSFGWVVSKLECRHVGAC